MVVQPDDVAGPGLLHRAALVGLEGDGIGHLHRLADAHMAHLHALGVAAGAHPQEGHPVAVGRVHVRLDLEHEAGEGRLTRLHHPLDGGAGARRRGIVDEGVEQLLDTEVIDGRAEKDRGLLAGAVGIEIQRVTGTLHQLHLAAQLVRLVAQELVHPLAVQPLDHLAGLDAAAVLGAEQMRAVVAQVIDALEALAHADRPGHRGALDLEHRLHLVQHLHRVAPLAVQLVDEGEDGGVAQPADVHQLDGALLHALGDVDHHQRRVHRGQGAVGVLGEVLMPGGVEQVDDGVAVRELHDRGGHGDPALFLQLHPVGGRMARRLAALDRAGHLDGTAEQQQLLGECGLARVRVGDDGKGAAAAQLVEKIAHKVETGMAAGVRLNRGIINPPRESRARRVGGPAIPHF